ncbi:Protein DedA [Austwickia sp. TVS 96-490-7B]|uniref:DedA family protein n=1 Tax=Austwickia sp. TVS 96-490-7B TaxID=2830843 RepID=UPI001C58BEB7|nr:DedA family protein [Austwickia sp. TVS 96-490-7B]MBW3085481.1 Protein DedA [Austwickia sp. TVS 96-490-7B]
MPALGPDWLDPEFLLNALGPWATWGAAAIVFAECGLFTAFLPGDSLLFTVGLMVGRGNISQPLWLVCLVLFLAAFLGNVIGYEIGRAIGAPLRHRDGRIIKAKYFDQTEEFFEKYGNKALVLGRFVPIVRTFITVVAGIGRMDRKRFFTYSGVGAFLWAVGVTILGYYLGQFDVVKKNIEAALVLIVVVSVLPMVFEYLAHRRRSRLAAEEAAAIAAEYPEEPADIRYH